MDLLGMLNVLIGLTFVYFVLSLIVSAIVEGYSQLRGTRANILETAVRRIIYNAPVINHQTFPLTTSCTCPLVDDFFKHDRIQSLQRDDEKKPSEIPNDIFAKVLLETVSGMKTTEIANCPWKFREAIAKLTRAENSIEATCPRVGGSSSKASLESKSSLEDMQTTLLRIYDKSAGNYDLILQETEKWCLEVGERARGWYKSKQQRNVFIAGLLVALAMNADTIAMFQHLSKDKQLQAAIIKEASALQGKSLEEALCTKEAKAKDDCKDLAAVKSYALDVSPLLGWENAPASCLEAFQQLIGILLTACALLMGAPFWYDMLQKLLKAKNSLTGGAADLKAGTNSAGDATSADTKNATASPRNPPTLPKFKPTATQLDFGNAFWLSLFADLAYAEPDAASAKCSEWGFQSITSGLARTHNTLDTQFLIAHNDQAIILAFRGSEKNLQDWAGNADFEQVAWQGHSGLGVHEGFSKAYAIVQQEIVEAVLKLMQSSRRPLWITGHSLGGAGGV